MPAIARRNAAAGSGGIDRHHDVAVHSVTERNNSAHGAHHQVIANALTPPIAEGATCGLCMSVSGGFDGDGASSEIAAVA